MNQDAREVFIKLVEAMEVDNCCEFDTTIPQLNLGVELVQPCWTVVGNQTK